MKKDLIVKIAWELLDFCSRLTRLWKVIVCNGLRPGDRLVPKALVVVLSRDAHAYLDTFAFHFFFLPTISLV
jgi:hypothetical protein